jgi:hypothetical protein
MSKQALDLLGRITIRYLRNVSVENTIQTEFYDILNKYLKIIHRKNSLTYIFFGLKWFREESRETNP